MTTLDNPRYTMIRYTLPVSPEAIINGSDLNLLLQSGTRCTVPTSERSLLRIFYRGKQEDIESLLMSNYAWLTPKKQAMLARYFTYVNLLKPAVNRIVSGVYGGRVIRTIEQGSPYREEVLSTISETHGYSQKWRNCFRNAVLFGDGVFAFTVVNNRVEVWRPNPLYTTLVTDPDDVTDVTAIVERLSTGKYRYVTKNEWGMMDASGMKMARATHGLGVVPAVISYGESQLEFGEVYGDSLVETGMYYSAVLTQLLLNQVALIMNYVSPQAVAAGQIKNEDPEEAFMGGVLELDEGGNFMFVTPKTNFQDLTATIDSYKTNFCISAGIPMDALDPSAIPENQSATSARLRNQPMDVTINRLVEEQITNETKALTLIGALYQYVDTREPVTMEQFADLFKCSVKIKPNGTPQSFAEEVSAWAQLVQMGAKTRADLVRNFNEDVSEEELAARVKEAEHARQGEGLYGGNSEPDAREGAGAEELSRDGEAD